MSNIVRRFEVAVLKPLQLLLIAAVLLCLINKMWLWSLAPIGCLALLGSIGAKLHPLLSAADLRNGPTTSDAALTEAAQLEPRVQASLVDRACTEVGLLAGIGVGLVLTAIGSHSWYGAVGIGFLVTIVVAIVLKLVFGTFPL